MHNPLVSPNDITFFLSLSRDQQTKTHMSTLNNGGHEVGRYWRHRFVKSNAWHRARKFLPAIGQDTNVHTAYYIPFVWNGQIKVKDCNFVCWLSVVARKTGISGKLSKLKPIRVLLLIELLISCFLKRSQDLPKQRDSRHNIQYVMNAMSKIK